MALALAKVTLSFTQGVYGWTESYFLSNPSSDLSAELTKGQTLASKRLLCSGEQTSIPYVKVSREDVKRDVKVIGLINKGPTGKISDAPDTAVLLRRFSTTPVANAPVFMRGVWDEVIINGGNIDYGNAVWIANVNSFGAYLASAGFGFVAKDPDTSDFAPVGSITQNSNGTVHIICPSNSGSHGTDIFQPFPVNTKIKCFVSGVKGAASVNGSNIFIVRAVNAVDSEKQIPMFPYTTGGTISYTQPKFYPDVSIQKNRVVERKAGRPLYVSRGRSRGRVLA